MQLRVGACEPPKLNKGPHDFDVDSNRPLASQHRRQHRHSLLSKDIGRIATSTTLRVRGSNLRPQTFRLGFAELEHEVTWKALPVPFHLLNQPFRLNAVEVCEVLVQHHLSLADDEDPSIDCRRLDEVERSHL